MDLSPPKCIQREVTGDVGVDAIRMDRGGNSHGVDTVTHHQVHRPASYRVIDPYHHPGIDDHLC